MADNLLYTQGTGTTIATDDVGSVHFQKIKLDVGGDGASLQVAGSVPIYIVSGAAGIASNPFIISGAISGYGFHDSPVNYPPMLMGGYAEVAGDSDASNLVSAEGDLVRIAVGRDGSIYTKPHPTRIWHYSQEFTTQQTDYNIHSGVANLCHYICSIYFAANAAGNALLKDGTAVTSNVKWKYYAGGQGDGVAMAFNPPLKCSTNTAVGFTTSTGVTCFLAITGYTAP